MKKYLNWIIPLIIIILAVAFLWVIKTPLTAAYLSKKLKTHVVISNISIATNHVIIDDFKLTNPRKTKGRYAFTAGKIQINYSFSKLFSSPSIIDNISIENVNLDIECNNPLCTTNNWTTISNNIKEKEPKKESKEMIIKKLSIRNLNAKITGFGLDFYKTKKSHIGYIEFNNISSKTGFPTNQLISAIFKSAGLQDYLKNIIESKSFIEGILKTL